MSGCRLFVAIPDHRLYVVFVCFVFVYFVCYVLFLYCVLCVYVLLNVVLFAVRRQDQ